MKIFGPFTEKDQELLDFHLLIYSLTAVLFISSVLLFRKMFPESSPIFHNLFSTTQAEILPQVLFFPHLLMGEW